MIQAMIEVGYYAMTVANHEFDFGQDQILSLRNEYQEDDKFYILSNNTKKDSKYIFDRSTIVKVKGKNVGIIGVTTPETKTKSHPKNTEGIVFTNPLEEVMKDIDSINNSVDYIVILAHLGQDGQLKTVNVATLLLIAYPIRMSVNQF